VASKQQSRRQAGHTSNIWPPQMIVMAPPTHTPVPRSQASGQFAPNSAHRPLYRETSLLEYGRTAPSCTPCRQCTYSGNNYKIGLLPDPDSEDALPRHFLRWARPMIGDDVEEYWHGPFPNVSTVLAGSTYYPLPFSSYALRLCERRTTSTYPSIGRSSQRMRRGVVFASGVFEYALLRTLLSSVIAARGSNQPTLFRG